jgi:hypothetical protein
VNGYPSFKTDTYAKKGNTRRRYTGNISIFRTTFFVPGQRPGHDVCAIDSSCPVFILTTSRDQSNTASLNEGEPQHQMLAILVDTSPASVERPAEPTA